jgi:protein TonB
VLAGLVLFLASRPAVVRTAPEGEPLRAALALPGADPFEIEEEPAPSLEAPDPFPEVVLPMPRDPVDAPASDEGLEPLPEPAESGRPIATEVPVLGPEAARRRRPVEAPAPSDRPPAAPPRPAAENHSPLVVLFAPDPRAYYPDSARARGTEGQVLVGFRVREDGTVGDARVERSSGVDVLDDAALRVVRDYRFAPLEGPRPARIWVRFHLRQAGSARPR